MEQLEEKQRKREEKRDEELQDRFAQLTLSLSTKDRPRRTLSYLSKSAAWAQLQAKHLGVDFYFPLVTQTLETIAFKDSAPSVDKDEIKVHHPYFLCEVAKLIKSAGELALTPKPQLYWSKSGHWLGLDDSPGTFGVEPDFSTTETVDKDLLVANPDNGVRPPHRSTPCL
jgi:hypothetical protein